MACVVQYRVLKWWRHKNEISEIMGFVRIFWKNNVQEACFPKMSIWGRIVSEIVAQLYSENSIQTLLIFLGSTQKSGRLQELKNNGNSLNFQAQKVVAAAYRRWLFARGSNCKALTGNFLVFLIGGVLWEVVEHGGSTVPSTDIIQLTLTLKMTTARQSM